MQRRFLGARLPTWAKRRRGAGAAAPQNASTAEGRGGGSPKRIQPGAGAGTRSFGVEKGNLGERSWCLQHLLLLLLFFFPWLGATRSVPAAKINSEGSFALPGVGRRSRRNPSRGQPPPRPPAPSSPSLAHLIITPDGRIISQRTYRPAWGWRGGWPNPPRGAAVPLAAPGLFGEAPASFLPPVCKPALRYRGRRFLRCWHPPHTPFPPEWSRGPAAPHGRPTAAPRPPPAALV